MNVWMCVRRQRRRRTLIAGGFVVLQLFTSVICSTLGDIEGDAGRDGKKDGDFDSDSDDDSEDDFEGKHVGKAAISRIMTTVAKTKGAVSHFGDLETEYLRRTDIFRKIVNHWIFDNFIIACISINSLSMISSHHNPPQWYLVSTGYAEFMFTIVFISEFTLKNLAFGVVGYWSDDWNKLDGFIVLSSLLEMIMWQFAASGFTFNVSFLRVFRIFRIIRTFRILRNNKEFVRILNSAINGVQAMWVFLVVWALFLVIFAILGVHLFAGRGTLDDDRLGFRDVGAALLTLFVISTGENTFEVASATMQATNVWAGLYMVAWLVISTSILSLILGILIDAINEENNIIEAGDDSDSEGGGSDDEDGGIIGAGGDYIPTTEEVFGTFDDDDDKKKKDKKLAEAKGNLGGKKTLRQGFAMPRMDSFRKFMTKPKKTEAERAEAQRKRDDATKIKLKNAVAEVAVVRRWLVSIGEAGISVHSHLSRCIAIRFVSRGARFCCWISAAFEFAVL